ncbi:nucleoside 2-deoxyribosyltransferase [Dapis sp. BLCC M229]|uniref:nucleoside 2-deoxyribosyltransferase n=1 Tax=Dapis sp. BLCC M229 TaxID=3400188 RepID=UPI003CEF2046
MPFILSNLTDGNKGVLANFNSRCNSESFGLFFCKYSLTVELGVAIALNKKVFLFRDDFRHCTDSESYPLNLMIFAGLPEKGWENYYYKSVEEIDSEHKALYKWLLEDSEIAYGKTITPKSNKST